MRCIEISNRKGDYDYYEEINRNMRCIEILLWMWLLLSFPRLIETWDVLKWLKDGVEV